MQYLARFFTLICFCLPFSLAAQHSVVGDWQYSVTTPDGQTMNLKVSFAEDNTFAVDLGNDGSIDINGEYELEGDRLTIRGVSGPGLQCSEAGIYKVEVSSDNMKMTKISDPCPGRGGPEGVVVFKRA